jgi:hypothetical protein
MTNPYAPLVLACKIPLMLWRGRLPTIPIRKDISDTNSSGSDHCLDGNSEFRGTTRGYLLHAI